MKKGFKFILICISLIFNFQLFSQENIKGYQDDFLEYWTLLNKYHPKYIDSCQIANLSLIKDSIFKDISCQNNLVGFYKKLSLLASKINCIHTQVYLPTDIAKNLKIDSIFFPFIYIIKDSSLYILINNQYHEVIEINGQTSISVIDEIKNHISSDNNNYYYKDWAINNFFSIYYTEFIQTTNQYSILLDDSVINIRGYTFTELINQKSSLNQKLLYSLSMVDSNFTYLRIGSFDLNYLKSKNINYKLIIKTFFKDIQKNDVNNIIIDIRDNGGGNATIPIFILKYLARVPYSFYERIEYKTNNYKPYFNLSSTSFKKENNYYVRKKIFNYQKQITPKNDSYKGNIYVLINGANVSMAVAFIKKLITVNSNVILIGKPVGGNFNFNAGSYVKKELENSKIKIKIPIEKITVDTIQSNYIIAPNLYIEDNQFIESNGEINYIQLINLIKKNGMEIRND